MAARDHIQGAGDVVLPIDAARTISGLLTWQIDQGEITDETDLEHSNVLIKQVEAIDEQGGDDED